MTTSIIVTNDPVTETPVLVDPSLRARVESAASLLEGELQDLDTVEVQATWQYLNEPTGPAVRLRLAFADGSTSIRFSSEDFGDLDRIRNILRRKVSDLHFLILDANREKLKELRNRLGPVVTLEG